MRQVVIHPDPEDGGWIAEVPSLPGCFAQGDTKEEVMRSIREAVAVWVAGAEATGQQVPEDSSEVEICQI